MTDKTRTESMTLHMRKSGVASGEKEIERMSEWASGRANEQAQDVASVDLLGNVWCKDVNGELQPFEVAN